MEREIKGINLIRVIVVNDNNKLGIIKENKYQDLVPYLCKIDGYLEHRLRTAELDVVLGYESYFLRARFLRRSTGGKIKVTIKEG